MNFSKSMVLLLALCCIAMFAAGCTSSKTTTAPATPAATTPAPAATAAAAAPATTAKTCVDASGKGIWTASWDTYFGDRCQDNRHHFYPATTDNPDPWTHTVATEFNVKGTITQNNCDVTGSMKIVGNTVNENCPISLTGTVDGTSVKGTWKAYCDISTSTMSDAKDDSGTFTIYMNPENNGFIGVFQGNSKAIAERAAECPTQNGNWAGKKA